MLGASVYVVPFMIQRNVPGIGSWVLPAFLFAAVPALLAALAYAILASAMPRAGGSYLYASRGLHPYSGFVASFSQWFGLSIVIGVIAYIIVPFFRDIAVALEWVEAAALRQHLTSGLAAYDFVLIDCPPSLGQLTQSALGASTEVLMPIQCEYFAMEGLTQMIHVIRRVMQQYPGRLDFGGILLTMYDDNLELTHEVDREVRDFFGEIVYDVSIPRDVAVAEAPSHGKSVIDYAPRARGTRAYIELCMEVLNRE